MFEEQDPATVLTLEELLVAYYIKGFPISISMWVKCAHKPTLQGAFAKDFLVEKDMFNFKDNPDLGPDQPSTSRRRKENISNPHPKIKTLMTWIA